MAAATAVRRQVRELTLAGCRLLPRADGGLADRGAVATVAVLRARLALRLTADEATPAAAGVLQAIRGRGTTFVRARARLLQARTGRRGSRRGAGLAAFAGLVGVLARVLLAPLGVLARAVLGPARVLGRLPRLDHLRPLGAIGFGFC